VMKIPRPGVLTGAARRVARLGFAWLRDPEGRREERAATSLVMFIMFFPLIVGSFGLGVDVARNIWIRSSLQNAVDTAVVGGAAVTDPHVSPVVIDPAGAIAETRMLYGKNRGDHRGLKCPPSWSCWERDAPAVSPDGRTLTFGVHEETTNAFLMLLGQPTQEYNLNGKARLSLSTDAAP
jgi:hypothetical protein